MSSLRNAVKRKTHKERAQPAERRRLGLLEKHKDYVLRAKDFHRKQDTLKELRVKASFRNPDEFYFRMEHTRTKGGVHVAPSKQWTEDELALMRSQDRGYILTRLQAERKKVEKLQASLHSISDPNGGAGEQGAGLGPVLGNAKAGCMEARPRHVVFVDGDEEDPEGGEGGTAVGSRDGGGQGDAESGRGGSAAGEKKIQRKMAAAYRELQLRQERAERLAAVLQHMELQKALSGKGRKRKITTEDADGNNVTAYKWAKQRQR